MRYQIIITRNTTESATVYVYADSTEEADKKALDVAIESEKIGGPAAIPYVRDDCATSDPYITSNAVRG